MSSTLKYRSNVCSRLSLFAATVALSILAILSAAAAGILTLDGRPNTPFDDSSREHLRTQAATIGWGGLFYNHSMANMSSDYLAKPWISAGATPFLPTAFFLESRAWAVKNRVSPSAADKRLLETFRNPDEQMGRKKRLLNHLHAIRPLPSDLSCRAVHLITLRS